MTDEEFDIVAAGYDAGVRLGEVIEQDMIAVVIGGEERQLAVCAPSYRQRFGVPEHPRELAAHRCIGWRPGPKLPPYRWEFAEDGKEFSVAVAPEITTSDMALMIKLAVAGAGITFGMEESFRPAIARGEPSRCCRNSARISQASISTIRAAAPPRRSCAPSSTICAASIGIGTRRRRGRHRL